jgi:FlaA1/EpsC-like NDP-sugar epimerase
MSHLSRSDVFANVRNRHFLVVDLLALAIVPTVALALRLDGLTRVADFAAGLLTYTVLGIGIRLLVFHRAGLYIRYWRYASVDEIALIVFAVTTATISSALAFFVVRWLLPIVLPAAPQLDFPRSVPFIDLLLTLTAVSGTRFSIRLLEHAEHTSQQAGRRVLIVGAGDAGRLVAKEIQANPHLDLEAVGFVDDDKTKHGQKIAGLPVLGDRNAISRLVAQYRIHQAVIAMPAAPGKTIREIVELSEASGIETKTMPGLYELLSGEVQVTELRDVEIDDLLRRDPVRLDSCEVAAMIQGKRVLVTGAGGSIGSELCRQIVSYGPAELVLVGHGENSVFNIAAELKHWRRAVAGGGVRRDGLTQTPPPGHNGGKPVLRESDLNLPAHRTPTAAIHAVIADIRDRSRMEAVLQQYRPNLVFHAAAHKHVPLMEQNVEEAVTNNVLGTRCLIQAAEAAGVQRFVLISTDKAVNPTSVMGVTKRIAERLIQASATRNGRVFVAVRFGNVLGSRGSVLQVFRKQIARGGPVTVTHPDMQRYFMTIPEAVQLVLQAAAIGSGGEVFVLDMGAPVRIVDLARDLVELSGFEVGRDIDIVFSGIRPGEKLMEDLIGANEVCERTDHAAILMVREEQPHATGMGAGLGILSGNAHNPPGVLRDPSSLAEYTSDVSDLESQVDLLIDAARAGEVERLNRLLYELVPEYNSTRDLQEPL